MELDTPAPAAPPPSTRAVNLEDPLIQQIIQQRDERLYALKQSIHTIGSSISALLHHAKLSDTEITSDATMATDSAKIASRAETLVSAVESALGLVKEVRRDLIAQAVASESGEKP